jgi:hypothetical protein
MAETYDVSTAGRNQTKGKQSGLQRLAVGAARR